MTEDGMGTVLRDGERVGLRFRRRLRHGPDRIWRALTESADLRHWFPCDLIGERRPGAPLEMPFWPEGIEKYGLAETPVLYGEIHVWDPPTVLEYRWDTEVLRWELAAQDGGTELTLTTWLVPAVDAPPAESAAAGYHTCLDLLAQVLDTGKAEEPADAAVEALQDRYRRALTAGTP